MFGRGRFLLSVMPCIEFEKLGHDRSRSHQLHSEPHTVREGGRGERERSRDGERGAERGRGTAEGQVIPLCHGDIYTLLPARVAWRLYPRAIHLIPKWLSAAAIARKAARVSGVNPQVAADDFPEGNLFSEAGATSC